MKTLTSKQVYEYSKGLRDENYKKIKNGFGVMLDDVLAGIYSVIVFFLIFIGLNYA